ncbi:hypothetical protein C4K22_3231 [Pseudomonas chlororaphis subsp. aurantiaca]|uniref:fimbrial protein n=1 Tax=Pseudomonas chlororaphis TaxID=587753 RepID=UPI000F6DA4EA|nr:fimbrial protein [Pseudomonas chlororaphis]AZD35974.1 hypothetical protein C4K22_3231 [Pseudomonas chlororaphis subsp. aurantiaca]AZD42311.1 hypothetical protein C4K21_3237 [Pseudomonas chlororaphis subsp. aurantiaca]AZD48510.1 hypothetical protein C4K20_3095 [Pseudomonas chlororaphis subsp. aurantiaca]
MKFRIVSAVFFSIFFVLAMPVKNADAGGWFIPEVSTVAIPVKIEVPNNAAIGTRLWKSASVTSTLIDGAASFTAQIAGRLNDRVLAPGFTDVYKTNIPGLGVKWMAIWKARNFPGGRKMVVSHESEHSPGQTGWVNNDQYVQEIWLELYKIGPIQSSRVSLKSSVIVQFNCPGCKAWNISTSGETELVAGPVCTASSPTIPVSLRRVSIEHFSGVGSTSDAQTFNITLSCSGGRPGSSVNARVQLTDASKPENTSNHLTLSSDSTASGLGINILKDGAALVFGPDSASSGANQWSAGVIAQGVSTFQIPLSARYVQIAPKIVSGKANGRATFTISYQ